MEGDKIFIKDEYNALGFALADIVVSRMNGTGQRFSVTIAGESGCGKSVTARVLADQLVARSLSCQVLSQDDYFKLPPRTNHEARLKDVNAVGPEEVDMTRLQQHHDAFLNGETTISSPLVFYAENRIDDQEISLQNIDVLLIEGTYVSMLERPLLRIFMTHTYLQTKKQRWARNRDELSDFNENVLAREHKIIASHAAQADILINSNYEIELTR